MAKIWAPSNRFTWDERMDIRKHALECACRAFTGNCTQPEDAKDIIEMAKAFEEHLTRKVGNG